MYVATSNWEVLHVMDAARALVSLHEHAMAAAPILVVADAELKAVRERIEALSAAEERQRQLQRQRQRRQQGQQRRRTRESMIAAANAELKAKAKVHAAARAAVAFSKAVADAEAVVANAAADFVEFLRRADAYACA